MKIYHTAFLPRGFSASAVSCGLKKSGKLDLALFYSRIPAKAKGVFTSNTMAAAPVRVCREHLARAKSHRAIIANSGNANCFTGVQGMRDAREMAASAARHLGVESSAVLIGSTGIIGKRLAIGKIKSKLNDLVQGLSGRGISPAKKAIMTTDRFTKEATAVFSVGKAKVTVCAVAKGAGMIAPNMATMLAFVFTDARITARALDQALRSSVDATFNCITVDGCMSTNDSVIVMANGAADNRLIDERHGFAVFQQALHAVLHHLAVMMVKDGEGATKFIRINIVQAASEAEAKKAALAVANSNLFKTAMYGQNPNFGRIVAAIGASGIPVQEEKLKIRLSDLRKKEITVDVGLGRGRAQAAVYTSDLTPEYIKINAAYN